MPFDLLEPASWARAWPFYLAAVGFGYLLGAIPFGVVIARVAGLGDLRKIGSGNIGATNVLRTGNRWAALATLLGDGGKGAAAVLLARWAAGDAMAALAGVGAFLGHLFPVWLSFKGGKGVATFLGTVLALSFPVGALAAATWLVVALVTRLSSLSALIAAVATPIYFWLFGQYLYVGFAVLLAGLIVVTHRSNIRRLLTGEEPRIGGTGSR